MVVVPRAQHAAATTIRTAWLAYAGKIQLRDMKTAALQLQRVARGKIGRGYADELRRQKIVSRRQEAAARIQAAVRGHQCRLTHLLAALEAQKQSQLEMDDWRARSLASNQIFRAWKAKLLRMHVFELVRRRRRTRIVHLWQLPLRQIRLARSARKARGRLTKDESDALLDVVDGAEEELCGREEQVLPMRLRVTVFECRGLPKVDAMGANDVYVTVGADSKATARTATKHDAGAAAHWGEGGEQVVLVVEGSPTVAPGVSVSVFDEDIAALDSLIGTHTLAMPSEPIAPGWECEPRWCKLTDAEGLPAGAIRLQVRWALPTPEWGLRVVVYECRELQKVAGAKGKSDVAVQLFADNRSQQPRRTSTRPKTAASCQWGFGRGEDFVFVQETAPDELHIEVLDEAGPGSDGTIGTVCVALPSNASSGEWSLEPRWYDLNSGEVDNSSGKVRLSCSWESQTGQAEYDAIDLSKHFEARVHATELARGQELAPPPSALLQRRDRHPPEQPCLANDGSALGGFHMRMFASQRAQEWPDHGEHAYMVTVGCLQSVNILPHLGIGLGCDVTLDKRDRSKELAQKPVVSKAGHRALHVTVLECRHLKKMDIFGRYMRFLLSSRIFAR